MRTFVNNHILRLSLAFVSLLCIVGCDQATKTIAKDVLTETGPVSFFGNIIRLQYVENPGAFLGIGGELPPTLRFWIFGVVVAVALVGTFLYLIFKPVSTATMIGLVMILGGGIGNLIDRMTYGQVADFLNIGIGSIRTGIFNVADMAILFGAVFLLVKTRFHPTQN